MHFTEEQKAVLKEQGLFLTEEQKLMLKGKVCPYCHVDTKLVKSTEVYSGRDYGYIYSCPKCGAYVGCHKDTVRALGRVANEYLRRCKNLAHHYFDQIWKKGYMDRRSAYNWLAEQMAPLGIPREYIHIGMFGPKTCLYVAKISYLYLKDMDYGHKH